MPFSSGLHFGSLLLLGACAQRKCAQMVSEVGLSVVFKEKCGRIVSPKPMEVRGIEVIEAWSFELF